MWQRIRVGFLASLVIFASGTLPAQIGKQVMKGTVVDAEGTGIVSAIVSLSQLPVAIPIRRTSTDREGAFTFEDVSAGDYLLTAESIDSQSSGGMPVIITRVGNSRDL